MTRYGYGLADPNTAANGDGTIAITLGSPNVTGTSTHFLTQLVVGDVVTFGGYSYAVATISNNTIAILDSNSKTTETTAAYTITPIKNVESLSTPVSPPKSTFRPYTDSVLLANGKVRGLGRPVASWKWGFITLAMRTVLRPFCTAKSNTVYVRTRTNEGDVYHTFTATIVWPDDEDKQTGRRINFILEFKNLVQL